MDDTVSCPESVSVGQLLALEVAHQLKQTNWSAFADGDLYGFGGFTQAEEDDPDDF